MIAALLFCLFLVQQPLPQSEETPLDGSHETNTDRDAQVFDLNDFFQPSPEMKMFLDTHVRNRVTEEDKLRALLHLIFDKDKLNMTYSNYQTMTPRQTFNARTGNCLSFTGMFIVMARYCHLYAQFQEVSDASSWAKHGKFMVYNRHMNSIVFIHGRKVEVDFNYQVDKNFKIIHRVSDRRGIAHYYNNLGAECLAMEKYDRARYYFMASIKMDPEFSQGLTNLGVLERVTGHYELAETYYLQSAKLNRFDYTPLMNLALLYNMQGKIREADRLTRKVRRFKERNPFYHYTLGRTSLDEKNYRDAISHFKRALRIHKTNPRFLVGLAAAYQMTGKLEKARKLVLKAKDLVDSKDKYIYDLKLQRLYANK
jgi:Flp pilus assembly protein TadD